MQRSQSAASSYHPFAAAQSDLAISMYGYGLASKRVAAMEGMTPRSARAWIVARFVSASSSTECHHDPTICLVTLTRQSLGTTPKAEV